MKLIIAVVNDKDAGPLMEDLIENNYQATKLASTGGFLREGNTTLMIGLADTDVDKVMELLKKNCKSRKKTVTPVAPVGNSLDVSMSFPTEVQVGGATVFVVNVEKWEKI